MAKAKVEVKPKNRTRNLGADPGGWVMRKGRTKVREYGNYWDAMEGAKALAQKEGRVAVVYNENKKSSRTFDFRSMEDKRKDRSESDRLFGPGSGLGGGYF